MRVMDNYTRPMPPPPPNYPRPLPSAVGQDNQVASTVFAIVIGLLALPVIAACSLIAMLHIVGLPFGMALVVAGVGSVVATGFLIPEVYGWMRKHI